MSSLYFMSSKRTRILRTILQYLWRDGVCAARRTCNTNWIINMKSVAHRQSDINRKCPFKKLIRYRILNRWLLCSPAAEFRKGSSPIIITISTSRMKRRNNNVYVPTYCRLKMTRVIRRSASFVFASKKSIRIVLSLNQPGKGEADFHRKKDCWRYKVVQIRVRTLCMLREFSFSVFFFALLTFWQLDGSTTRSHTLAKSRMITATAFCFST